MPRREAFDATADDHDEAAIQSMHEVPPHNDRSSQETAYLLRSPENARCLAAAIERLETGGGIQRAFAGGPEAG